MDVEGGTPGDDQSRAWGHVRCGRSCSALLEHPSTGFVLGMAAKSLAFEVGRYLGWRSPVWPGATMPDS